MLSTKVLDKRDSSNKSYKGNFVRCSNCGRVMLTNVNIEACPVCGMETLRWEADEYDVYEVDESYFEDNDDYVLVGDDDYVV